MDRQTTDGWTNRQAERTALPVSLMWSVGKETNSLTNVGKADCGLAGAENP